MARIVDGKIVLGIEDSNFIDLLAEVRARNEAREQQASERPKIPSPGAPA